MQKRPKQQEKKEENKINNQNTKSMDTKEKIQLANEILDTPSKIKRIKKDKGLIERMESTKSIITEDNKELLMG